VAGAIQKDLADVDYTIDETTGVITLSEEPTSYAFGLDLSSGGYPGFEIYVGESELNSTEYTIVDGANGVIQFNNPLSGIPQLRAPSNYSFGIDLGSDGAGNLNFEENRYYTITTDGTMVLDYTVIDPSNGTVKFDAVPATGAQITFYNNYDFGAGVDLTSSYYQDYDITVDGSVATNYTVIDASTGKIRLNPVEYDFGVDLSQTISPGGSKIPFRITVAGAEVTNYSIIDEVNGIIEFTAPPSEVPRLEVLLANGAEVFGVPTPVAIELTNPTNFDFDVNLEGQDFTITVDGVGELAEGDDYTVLDAANGIIKFMTVPTSDPELAIGETIVIGEEVQPLSAIDINGTISGAQVISDGQKGLAEVDVKIVNPTTAVLGPQTTFFFDIDPDSTEYLTQDFTITSDGDPITDYTVIYEDTENDRIIVEFTTSPSAVPQMAISGGAAFGGETTHISNFGIDFAVSNYSIDIEGVDDPAPGVNYIILDPVNGIIASQALANVTVSTDLLDHSYKVKKSITKYHSFGHILTQTQITTDGDKLTTETDRYERYYDQEGRLIYSNISIEEKDTSGNTSLNRLYYVANGGALGSSARTQYNSLDQVIHDYKVAVYNPTNADGSGSKDYYETDIDNRQYNSDNQLVYSKKGMREDGGSIDHDTTETLWINDYNTLGQVIDQTTKIEDNAKITVEDDIVPRSYDSKGHLLNFTQTITETGSFLNKVTTRSRSANESDYNGVSQLTAYIDTNTLGGLTTEETFTGVAYDSEGRIYSYSLDQKKNGVSQPKIERKYTEYTIYDELGKYYEVKSARVDGCSVRTSVLWSVGGYNANGWTTSYNSINTDTGGGTTITNVYSITYNGLGLALSETVKRRRPLNYDADGELTDDGEDGAPEDENSDRHITTISSVNYTQYDALGREVKKRENESYVEGTSDRSSSRTTTSYHNGVIEAITNTTTYKSSGTDQSTSRDITQLDGSREVETYFNSENGVPTFGCSWNGRTYHGYSKTLYDIMGTKRYHYSEFHWEDSGETAQTLDWQWQVTQIDVAKDVTEYDDEGDPYTVTYTDVMNVNYGHDGPSTFMVPWKAWGASIEESRWDPYGRGQGKDDLSWQDQAVDSIGWDDLWGRIQSEVQTQAEADAANYSSGGIES